MNRPMRITALIGISLLLGAGCGSGELFTSTNTDIGSNPEDLNMPGVPYGTYKKAQGDINTAQQAEANWQAQIK